MVLDCSRRGFRLCGVRKRGPGRSKAALHGYRRLLRRLGAGGRLSHVTDRGHSLGLLTMITAPVGHRVKSSRPSEIRIQEVYNVVALYSQRYIKVGSREL